MSIVHFTSNISFSSFCMHLTRLLKKTATIDLYNTYTLVSFCVRDASQNFSFFFILLCLGSPFERSHHPQIKRNHVRLKFKHLKSYSYDCYEKNYSYNSLFKKTSGFVHSMHNLNEFRVCIY